jgi:hypothetical protein
MFLPHLRNAMLHVAVLSEMGRGGIIQLGYDQSIHGATLRKRRIHARTKPAITAYGSVFTLQLTMKVHGKSSPL